MKSIMQEDKSVCYLCDGGATEEHHVFGASNRKWSEKYGLKVYLCHWCHNEPPNGVHFNKDNRLRLQRTAQKIFDLTYPELSFRQIFGRNYL